MNTLKPGSPAMDAYENVRKAITQRELTPGSALTESFLCETLGIGRSPVRAALQQLSDDGFVELLPNRSARVAQFTQSQIGQLYSLRGMVLAYALERTIDLYTDEDIAFLNECLDLQEDAFEGQNFDEYLLTFYRFYLYIVQKANNPYLNEFSDSILKRINVYLCLYDNFYSVKRLKTLPLYRKMIKGIQEKKIKVVLRAHSEINSHILDAYDYVIVTKLD